MDPHIYQWGGSIPPIATKIFNEGAYDMSKIRKIYTLSEETVQKIKRLQNNSPNISASEIVEASIMAVPDNAVIQSKTRVEYTITKTSTKERM